MAISAPYHSSMGRAVTVLPNGFEIRILTDITAVIPGRETVLATRLLDQDGAATRPHDGTASIPSLAYNPAPRLELTVPINCHGGEQQFHAVDRLGIGYRFQL